MICLKLAINQMQYDSKYKKSNSLNNNTTKLRRITRGLLFRDNTYFILQEIKKHFTYFL